MQQGHFNYLYNVTFIDIFSANTKEVDILLTTGTFKDLKKVYPQAQLVVIGRRLELNDLNRLTQVLDLISKEKQKI